MLREGDRWWALIGVAADLPPGLYPVSVTYVPPGQQAAANIVASFVVTRKDFGIAYIELDEASASLLAPEIVQAEIARRAAIFSGFTAQRLWSGPFVAPARGSVSSPYGEGRSYNQRPATDYHHGTDFIGDVGSPVVASAAGRVAFAGELRVRGNSIIIDHGAGLFTAYHHLSAIDVAEGQSVTAGQRIGAIGATGAVTGPHLHWEVIVRGVEVDGALWLKGTEIGP
jgi:murein DD-endopeptidase MepM/ murein hydrolase activator NlpD